MVVDQVADTAATAGMEAVAQAQLQTQHRDVPNVSCLQQRQEGICRRSSTAGNADDRSLQQRAQISNKIIVFEQRHSNVCLGRVHF